MNCEWVWKWVYRVITFAAAIQLVRFRWARWEIGPWLLALSLLMVHLDWEPLSVYLPPGFGLVTDLLFGASLLMVVLDDSSLRTRRLGVVNALTNSISRAQQHGPMMATALAELKRLMHAKAAWFRLFEGDQMVIAQQIGPSPDFLFQRPGHRVHGRQFERTLSGGAALVVRTSASDDYVRPSLKKRASSIVVSGAGAGKEIRDRGADSGQRASAFLHSGRSGVPGNQRASVGAGRGKSAAGGADRCARTGNGRTPSIPSKTWCWYTIPNSAS